jgi:uncharacterized membrane protein
MTFKPVTFAALSSRSARLSIVAIIVFQIILILLVFVRPDLELSCHAVIEWTLGPHEWNVALRFAPAGADCGSLFVAIKSQSWLLSARIVVGIFLSQLV